MTFADAVRFLRKCTVNELIALEHILEHRRIERQEERSRKERLKISQALQLL